MGRDDRAAAGGARQRDPGAAARGGQAVPDGGRGRVLDQGPRHGGDGPHRARQGSHQRRGRDHRLRQVEQDDGHWRRDVPEAAGRGPGWRQRRLPAARRGKGRHRARPGSGQAREHSPAQEVLRRGVRAEEGRGRAPHAVLQRLSSAVLLPHDGRHRLARAAFGHRDGHAGRQRHDRCQADRADRNGRGPALRDPRRRPHRRFGGCQQDHEVI